MRESVAMFLDGSQEQNWMLPLRAPRTRSPRPRPTFVEPVTVGTLNASLGRGVLVLRRNCGSLNASSKEAQGDPDRREAVVLAPACHWS